MKVLIVCWMLAATAIISGCVGMSGDHAGQSGQEEGGGGSY